MSSGLQKRVPMSSGWVSSHKDRNTTKRVVSMAGCRRTLLTRGVSKDTCTPTLRGATYTLQALEEGPFVSSP
jgi:hypothetical protein